MFRQVLCLALVSAACLFSGTAQAQQPRLQQGNYSQPRLGFRGHMEFGYGMAVDSVQFGSLAARLGLEPGDVVVQVNDVRIRTDADYAWALRNSGGRVRLLVDDVNGNGRLWTGTVLLNNGSGPIGNKGS